MPKRKGNDYKDLYLFWGERLELTLGHLIEAARSEACLEKMARIILGRQATVAYNSSLAYGGDDQYRDVVTAWRVFVELTRALLPYGIKVGFEGALTAEQVLDLGCVIRSETTFVRKKFKDSRPKNNQNQSGIGMPVEMFWTNYHRHTRRFRENAWNNSDEGVISRTLDFWANEVTYGQNVG